MHIRMVKISSNELNFAVKIERMLHLSLKKDLAMRYLKGQIKIYNRVKDER